MPTVLKDYTSYVLGFCGDQPSEEAFLFLHGFPANRGVRNRDIAEVTFEEFKQDCFLIHYRGLGESPGYFQFSYSIQESLKTANEILARGKYKSLNIYGHSWGSVVASNVTLALGNKVRNLILACPLTQFSKETPLLAGFLQETLREIPGLFGDQDLNQVKRDFLQIANGGQPWDIAPKLDLTYLNVSIVQALRDTYTPPEATREFLNRFAKKPHYLELDLDHSFMEDRPHLVRVVVNEFGRMRREK